MPGKYFEICSLFYPLLSSQIIPGLKVAKCNDIAFSCAIR
jgi:hypothetical protein